MSKSINILDKDYIQWIKDINVIDEHNRPQVVD